MYLFAFLNSTIDPASPVPDKEILVIPADTKVPNGEVRTRTLVLKDLSKYDIEMRMTELPNFPVFWCYYCTSGADVLGRLTLTESELLFTPLNDNFKGYHNYAGRSI